ncbi:hypothetical protein GTO10_06130 [Candidatus Saccharibacteria bacterium]|nr:hypothetical protein [Candidatus Saccharibacteria bacterium]
MAKRKFRRRRKVRAALVFTRAVHEAGHFVIGLELGLNPGGITLKVESEITSDGEYFTVDGETMYRFLGLAKALGFKKEGFQTCAGAGYAAEIAVRGRIETDSDRDDDCIGVFDGYLVVDEVLPLVEEHRDKIVAIARRISREVGLQPGRYFWTAEEIGEFV